ncbi:MAG TPA: LacI family DNA-binding transcriptional regulator [Trebonia sp.]|nr:LacI family DNA-binding transcriptional regulator [Trebonia sp.]
MVTLYDVARHAGVSTATVSRVLHGQGPVRDSTRARVRAAIEELGYVPDGAAQSLARNRKDVIGLVCVEHTGLKPNQYDIESMSLLFYDEVMRGVEARIRERSWSLLITFVREDENLGVPLPEDEPVQSRLLTLSGKVDGLLIGEGVVPSPVVTELARRLPVVVVAGDTALRGANVVSADNWSGAHALVAHLVAGHGRRRLFHVDGPATAPDAQTRRLAMRSVIGAHPGTVLTGSYSGRFTVHSGEEAAERLLAGGGTLPDAIVCANDQMAIGVLRTLAARRIRVPEEVAVVGFDDIFPASLCDPPLTTVHQPMRKIGERACDRLFELIAKPALRPRVELLPTELVIRSSCGCPPGTLTRLPVAPVAAPAGACTTRTRAAQGPKPEKTER